MSQLPCIQTFLTLDLCDWKLYEDNINYCAKSYLKFVSAIILCNNSELLVNPIEITTFIDNCFSSHINS